MKDDEDIQHEALEQLLVLVSGRRGNDARYPSRGPRQEDEGAPNRPSGMHVESNGVRMKRGRQ
ncbi:MAG TPA: hypothetical protein VM513_27705 [Kofleriaceae bacterium]|nr:hypothetical protein [Kofleriaceae bacterium]